MIARSMYTIRIHINDLLSPHVQRRMSQIFMSSEYATLCGKKQPYTVFIQTGAQNLPFAISTTGQSHLILALLC